MMETTEIVLIKTVSLYIAGVYYVPICFLLHDFNEKWFLFRTELQL